MMTLQYLFCMLFYGLTVMYLLVISRNWKIVVDCTRCTSYVNDNIYIIDNYDTMYVSECMSKCICNSEVVKAHKKLINQNINIPLK